MNSRARNGVLPLETSCFEDILAIAFSQAEMDFRSPKGLIFTHFQSLLCMRLSNWLAVIWVQFFLAPHGHGIGRPRSRSDDRRLQLTRAGAGIVMIESLEPRKLLAAATTPTVTAPTVDDVTSTTATLGGNVTFAGSSSLSGVGVLYSLTSSNPDPQLDGPGVMQLTTTVAAGLFTVNAGNLLPETSYSFVAYATNSAGTTFSSVSTFTTGVNHAPTVSVMATRNTSPITATTANLSVLGDDADTGESSLTYTWSLNKAPTATVSYSVNGTNTAKSTTVTFTASGTYAFLVTITDPSGATTTSSVWLAINVDVKNLSSGLYNVPTSPLPYGGTDPIWIAPAASIYSPDSDHLTEVTIQITGDYQQGRDILAALPLPGIDVSFDVASGTLTLKGTSTVSTYQRALQLVTYAATSVVASPFLQSLTITLKNGSSVSAPVVRSIAVNSTITSAYRIAALGDSLTYWRGGWISMLQSYYSPPSITAFAVGGYTTEQIYTSWASQVRKAGYKAISVLGGVNDIGHGESAAKTFSYLNRLYDEAMADGLQIAAFSMTPLGNWDANPTSRWTPEIQVQTELLNAMIAAKAAANPVQMRFIDSYKLMGDPTDPKKLNPIFDHGDGLHWNLAGHQMVASTYLAQLVSGTAVSGLNATGNYVQGTPALMFASNLVVTWPNGLNLQNATVSFANWKGGDRLEFHNRFALQHTFTQDLVAHTATLTITGSDSPAHYQATLRSLRYFNVAGQPQSSVKRIVTVTVTDSFGKASATSQLSVYQYLSGMNPAVSYLQGTAPVAVARNLVVTPPAGTATFTSAAVEVTNWQGEDRLAFYNSIALQHTLVVDLVAHTATLRIVGAATATGYQTLLRSVTYRNVAGKPNTSAIRTVKLTIYDGVNSVSVSTNVKVVPANQPPLVQVNDSVVPEYTVNGAPIAFLNRALVSDPDSDNISSLTVQITSGYQLGIDTLSFVNQAGIKGAFDATTGTLTLSGLSYVGNYRQALRSVTFQTSGSNSSPSTRMFAIIATDDTRVTSIPITRSLTLTR